MHHRRIQSFVRRDGRMTTAQQQAFQELWPQFGVLHQEGLIDLAALFGREAKVTLEIGFGSGQSLLELAKQHPEQNFIGIETYKPGIGSLLLGMQLQQLRNIRIFYADAVEVLNQCIPANSLDTIQLFFPDPWQKRKHHKRRLIQTEFVNVVTQKLKPQGLLHLATDWEDYAKHMVKVLSPMKQLTNLASGEPFAARSINRPLITKFEQRGRVSGRQIWELQYSFTGHSETPSLI